MTVDEYHLLPFEPGWKCEYWDGQAHFSPRHHAVVTIVAVTPREAKTSFSLRQPLESDLKPLVTLYLAAFSDSVEYCDYKPDQISKAAHKDCKSFFAGERSKPHSASRVALAPQSGPVRSAPETIIGVALILATDNGPLLHLLFVDPNSQRRGVATALVSSSLNELHALGEHSLTSKYHIGNEQSLAWHQKFGFIEEPDLIRSRLLRCKADHELWRREQIGDLSLDERERLAADVARWEAEVKRLERIEDEEGFEAVYPFMRW